MEGVNELNISEQQISSMTGSETSSQWKIERTCNLIIHFDASYCLKLHTIQDRGEEIRIGREHRMNSSPARDGTPLVYSGNTPTMLEVAN